MEYSKGNSKTVPTTDTLSIYQKQSFRNNLPYSSVCIAHLVQGAPALTGEGAQVQRVSAT